MFIHASAHETAISLGPRPPDGRTETDELGEEVHRSSTKRGADWNPESHQSVL
jgi:hypothetical protein